MGRSNKQQELQQSVETQQYQETYAKNSSASLYGGGATRQEAQPVAASSYRTSGAVSESEAIGRDIKEGRLSGFVGYGTVLTGETSFQAMLRVDGHLTGRVTSENGTLIVGSSGRVDANVLVAAAQVNGTINGDIIALERIELGRTARVMGNIQTPRLVIEDGAVFEGSCTMLKAQEALEQRLAEAIAQRSAPVQEETEPEAVTYSEEPETEDLTEAATI
jgi:cytoskeletal protein CcmA (bactofilin family)